MDGGNAIGGGICTSSALNVFDSTVTGNTTTGGEGGVGYYPFGDGTSGAATGGGIDSSAGTLTLSNSIVAANIADKSFDDIGGVAAAGGGGDCIGIGGGRANGVNGNKIGITDPRLSPLGYYGGPTKTLLPLPGSPAIDAGSNSLIPAGITTDQRGDPRITGKSVDIGSVEFGNVAIIGTVFNDEYATGTLHKSDPGVAGFTVYLDLNHDGKLDAGDFAVVTNASGQYTFDGLFAGSYTVDVLGEKTYRPTTASPVTIIARAAATTTVPAFGQTQDAMVAGTVFLDTNGNGAVNKGEAGLAGVRVFLDLNHNGKFVARDPSAVTTSTGSFGFSIPSPGTYLVRIVALAGYKQTVPTSGFYSVTVGKASIRSWLIFGEHKS